MQSHHGLRILSVRTKLSFLDPTLYYVVESFNKKSANQIAGRISEKALGGNLLDFLHL